jgi:hypothetical protein
MITYIEIARKYGGFGVLFLAAIVVGLFLVISVVLLGVCTVLS